MQTLRYYGAKISQATGIVALVVLAVIGAAPSYTAFALWAVLPAFAATYLFLVPWLWRRYPILNRFEPGP